MIFPIAAFFAVLVLVPLARGVALRFGYVDKPGGRKGHTHPTPPIGGLLVIPLFILLSFLSEAQVTTQWPFWLGLVILILSGALDDHYTIRPRWKFMAQFAAAFLIVLPGGATVHTLGNVLGLGALGLNFMAVPFSVIATVLLINAINLIDGLDGLAGGKCFVALGWLLVAALGAHRGADGLSITIMMGALLGFLAHNMRTPFCRRARVFLGDSGSMALGLALAWYGMGLAQGGVVWPVAVAWVFALPIMDTCAQFARRVGQGRHPFDADRYHFHHHFIDAGMPVGRAVAILLAIGFLCGGIGVGGMKLGVPEGALGWLWVVCILAHMGMSLRPHRYRRVIATLVRRA